MRAAARAVKHAAPAANISNAIAIGPMDLGKRRTSGARLGERPVVEAYNGIALIKVA